MSSESPGPDVERSSCSATRVDSEVAIEGVVMVRLVQASIGEFSILVSRSELKALNRAVVLEHPLTYKARC